MLSALLVTVAVCVTDGIHGIATVYKNTYIHTHTSQPNHVIMNAFNTTAETFES